MKRIDLKPLVTNAIESSWADFSREHPHLAGAIDQSLLVEQAADLLEDDPAYRAAMRKAEAINFMGEGIESFISSWISRWLRSLA